jgi:hypothetical protein
MHKLLLTILLLLPTIPARADSVDGVFGQGSTQFSLLAGSGYAFNSDYLIIGAGVNYYVLDGLGVGLSYENWSGNGPGISKTSPSVQYVFYQTSALQPYVGGFYRHVAIDGLPGINSVGGRAGVYFTSGRRSVIGVGLASESYLNCQATIYSSCSETYPEISIIFSF